MCYILGTERTDDDGHDDEDGADDDDDEDGANDDYDEYGPNDDDVDDDDEDDDDDDAAKIRYPIPDLTTTASSKA